MIIIYSKQQAKSLLHYTLLQILIQSVVTGPAKDYSSLEKSLSSTKGPFAADFLPQESHILLPEGAKITHIKFRSG